MREEVRRMQPEREFYTPEGSYINKLSRSPGISFTLRLRARALRSVRTGFFDALSKGADDERRAAQYQQPSDHPHHRLAREIDV